MRTLIFIYFVVAIAPLYAQQNGVEAQQNVNALAGASNLVRVYDTRYEGLKGSPFFLPYWCEGTIFFNDNRSPVNAPIKHDVYKNQIIAKRPQGDSVVFNSNGVSHFQLNTPSTGIDFLFKKFPDLKTDDPKLKEEYFQVAYHGRTALLIKRDKELVKANYQGGYNAGRTYDELVDASDYYLKKQDQTLTKVRLNKKAMIEALSDKQAAVKEFIEKEKIDFKNEASVVKLLNYYDTL